MMPPIRLGLSERIDANIFTRLHQRAQEWASFSPIMPVGLFGKMTKAVKRAGLMDWRLIHGLPHRIANMNALNSSEL